MSVSIDYPTEGAEVSESIIVKVTVAPTDRATGCTLFVNDDGTFRAYTSTGMLSTMADGKLGWSFLYDPSRRADKVTPLPVGSVVKLRANARVPAGVNPIPGAVRTIRTAPHGRIWRQDVNDETPRKITRETKPKSMPGGMFGEVEIISALDAIVPKINLPAEAVNVLHNTAAPNTLRQGSSKSAVGNEYPARVSWVSSGFTYDPAWANIDGMPGTHRHRTDWMALPENTVVDPGIIFLDWHNKWQPPIVLLGSTIAGKLDLLVRGGRMEALPRICNAKLLDGSGNYCHAMNPPDSRGKQCVNYANCNHVLGAGDSLQRPLWSYNTAAAKTSPYYYPRDPSDLTTRDSSGNLKPNYSSIFTIPGSTIMGHAVGEVSYMMEYLRVFPAVMDAPLGRWAKIDWDILWSSDRMAGFIEFTIDGKVVISGHMPTTADLQGSPVPQYVPDGPQMAYHQWQAYKPEGTTEIEVFYYPGNVAEILT